MALLEMKDICKSFHGVPVLKNAELSVEAGEVHALLGENGAGKSTMMNILTGSLFCDSGSIVFDGRALQDSSIRETEHAGIAFVHQELNLFNDLRVYENLFIGREKTTRFGKLRKKEMIAETRDLFQQLEVDIDPEAMVQDLTTSQKQILEISKAMHLKAKLIILDEPTTALTTRDVEHLFGMVGRLKKQGIAFIFISHKMPEIFAYADTYTVLRNGEFIGAGKISETTPEVITQMMVGKSAAAAQTYVPRKLGETVLEVQNLSGKGFADVSFAARRGEIVGFTGLQGSGSSEVMQAVFGTLSVTSGEVLVRGKAIHTGSVHSAMRAGLSLLPSNRKENSVLPDLSVEENLFLAEQTLSAWDFPIRRKKEREKYETFREELGIRAASGDEPVVSLSGGNQQKVFIARWLNTGSDILLFDNPTQGIDVGAKDEIYRLILEQASKGKTILVNTLEIPELIRVADRCIIFYDGRIIRELPHDEITEQRVMLYSTNSVEAG